MTPRPLTLPPQHPVIIGIALAPRWVPALERAAELLRERQPGLDDATLLEKVLVYGMVAVIDDCNIGREARNENDDTLCAIAEAPL